MDLLENERIDDLELKGLKIIQNKDGFCFGIDAVLLSDFCKDMKNNSLVIDLGTGTGILPILISGKTKASMIYGIEIQEEVADMANRSVVLNKLEEKIKIINTDIKNLTNQFKAQTFDVVVTNPPYMNVETGFKNNNNKKEISRHEIKANLDDFIKVSNYLLKDKGTLYMIHRSERLAEIIATLKEYKIEPKVLRFIYSNIKGESKLVLIKAIKSGNSGLKVDKPLIIYNNDSNYTNEILEIYNKNGDKNEE